MRAVTQAEFIGRIAARERKNGIRRRSSVSKQGRHPTDWMKTTTAPSAQRLRINVMLDQSRGWTG